MFRIQVEECTRSAALLFSRDVWVEFETCDAGDWRVGAVGGGHARRKQSEESERFGDVEEHGGTLSINM